MPHKFSIKEQVFNAFKEQLKHLSESKSADELLENSDQFYELHDLFTTLRVIQPLEEEKNTIQEEKEEILETFTQEEVLQEEESEENLDEEEQENEEEIEIISEQIEEDIVEEKEETIISDTVELDEAVSEEELYTEEIEEVEENNVAEHDELEETQEEDVVVEEQQGDEEEKEEDTAAVPQKVKLASIKGLGTSALFDEEELEEMVQEEEKEEVIPVSTKQDFKLDLNDKIAFSKILFGGRQTELNETIDVLNSFETIEEAQVYLSDMYYKKNWAEVEEYAQRLWSLVENKFH